MAELIQDNTSALEKSTEAQQEGARSLEELARIIRERDRELEGLPFVPPKSELKASPPPPTPTPPPPPAGTAMPVPTPTTPPTPTPTPPTPTPPTSTPPPSAPMAQWLTPQQAAAHQQQNPTPPPVPPHVAMFNRAVEMAMEKGKELREFHQQYPGMEKSPVARALQKTAGAQDEFIGNQWQALNPQEQKQAMPQMQALEMQRQEVEKEELKRRKELNEAMKDGRSSVRNFGHGLMQIAGLGSATTPVGAALTGISAFVGLMGKIAREGQAGVGLANPTVGKTAETSNRLRLAAQAEAMGNIETERERARFRQAQAALAHGQARQGRVPASTLEEAFSPNRMIDRIQQGFQAIEQWRFKRATEKTEEEMRRQGLLRPGEKFQPKEDMMMSGPARFTTGEEYYMQLGNAALESSGQQASNEELRRQLENVNMHLEQVVRNTGNANPPAFGS